jgi:hypothetical protein
MVERVWQYRGDGFGASDGVLIVGDDAIRFRPGLRQFVDGLLGRGHIDSQRPQAKRGRPSLGSLAMLGLGVVMLALGTVQVVTAGGATTGSLLNLFGGTTTLFTVWSTHLRETAVPLSSVERVTVDRRDDELTIRYEHDSRRSRLRFWPESWTTRAETVEPVGDDAVRDAREALCRRGVPVDVGHRRLVENGDHRCGSCRQRVSPSETTCPSCGLALASESEHTASTHDSVKFPSA